MTVFAGIFPAYSSRCTTVDQVPIHCTRHQPAGRERPVLTPAGPKYSAPSPKMNAPGPNSSPSPSHHPHTWTGSPLEAQPLHHVPDRETTSLLDPWPKAHGALSACCFCAQFHEWDAIELEGLPERDLTMWASLTNGHIAHPMFYLRLQCRQCTTNCTVCKWIAVG